MTLNGFMSWLIENVAAIVVGRSFGASALGTYNAAYNLARTTAGNLAGGGLDMVFTSSARADTAGPFRRRAFVASTSLISLLMMPAFVAAALLAETLVLALYGPRWPEAIPLLPPLALAMPALMLSGAASALLTGSGRIGRDSVVYAATLCVLLAGIAVAMIVSVKAVAWTVFGAILLRAVIALGTVLPLVGVGARELMIGLRAGLVLAATIPPILLALDVALVGLGLSRVLVLLVDLAVGGALFALGGLATRRLLPQEARWAVAQALRRIPFGVTARWARLFES
jgi:O-antigen/teichoic acid export membrane protein